MKDLYAGGNKEGWKIYLSYDETKDDGAISVSSSWFAIHEFAGCLQE